MQNKSSVIELNDLIHTPVIPWALFWNNLIRIVSNIAPKDGRMCPFIPAVRRSIELHVTFRRVFCKGKFLPHT